MKDLTLIVLNKMSIETLRKLNIELVISDGKICGYEKRV